jgi:hypothetical protein
MKNFRKSEQGRHQEAGPTPQVKFKRNTPSMWTPRIGMKMFFMVTASHLMNIVTNIWIADIMQGNILEDSITS